MSIKKWVCSVVTISLQFQNDEYDDCYRTTGNGTISRVSSGKSSEKMNVDTEEEIKSESNDMSDSMNIDADEFAVNMDMNEHKTCCQRRMQWMKWKMKQKKQNEIPNKRKIDNCNSETLQSEENQIADKSKEAKITI